MSSTERLTIGAGEIRFYNSFVPTLSAGPYEVEVRQEIDLAEVGDGDDGTHLFSRTQVLHVRAPRFALAPSDVHAAYPPANQEGTFDETLPHVVLRKRSLPWVRNLGDADNPRSWLALLLFHGDEAPSIETVPVADVVDRGGVPVDVTNQRGEAVKVLNPDIGAEPGDGERVQTITVQKDRFTEVIAPALDDLPYLAHVREVNTGDKELLGLDQDGWFSLVLGNRLPKPGLNTVHLVSLEGWVPYLRRKSGRARPIPPEVQSLRIVSLSSWSFTAEASQGSFSELAENLDVGLLRVASPVRAGASPAEHPDKAALAELFTAALEHGYVPLNYDMRHGEKTVAWYRGPLLPVSVTRAEKDPFPTAEAALIYDSRVGMFDVSYAVAWQIGRLLALSDPSFASALSRWRQQGQRLVDQLLEREEIGRRFVQTRLFADLDEIVMEPDADVQKEMLVELLAELGDPKAVLKGLADLVLPTPGADLAGGPMTLGVGGDSVLAVLQGHSEPKERLRGGEGLTEEEIEAMRDLPPGGERARKIRETIESRVGSSA